MTTETSADDILTAAEAAEIMDRSYMAVLALMRRGSLRGRKVGTRSHGTWVTTRHEVSAYMAWSATHYKHGRARPATGRFLGMP